MQPLGGLFENVPQAVATKRRLMGTECLVQVTVSLEDSLCAKYYGSL